MLFLLMKGTKNGAQKHFLEYNQKKNFEASAINVDISNICLPAFFDETWKGMPAFGI